MKDIFYDAVKKGEGILLILDEIDETFFIYTNLKAYIIKYDTLFLSIFLHTDYK